MKNCRRNAPLFRLLQVALTVLVVLSGSAQAFGQATTEPSVPDAATQKRLDALEREVAELRAREAAAGAATQSATTAPSDADTQKQIAAIQKQLNEKDAETNAAPQFPTLQFHGFGDINFHADTLKGDHNEFTLGEFDFFLSSQLADDVSVLSETVISADNTNFDGIEIERLMFSWNPSDYFNVDIGRYHTHVGYYNTTFHHGTWFQAATNRPFIDEFEDSGGIIPAHSVGMSFHGNIPGKFAEDLGIQYFAEWGNGHEYQSPTSQNSVVANVLDDNNYKAFNIAFSFKPEAIPGVETGFGFYHDSCSPQGMKTIEEMFYSAWGTYHASGWELMAEGYIVNHTRSGLDCSSYAYFGQIDRKIGAFTPYARFTYFDGSNADPLYALQLQTGRHYGPGVGLRWDFTTFASFKVEYDYMVNSQPGLALVLPFQPIRAGGYNQIQFQVDFTY
jgi:hypothetical protein